LELLTSKTAVAVVKPLFNKLKEAHQLYSGYRVSVFLSAINVEVETMSVENLSEFDDLISCNTAKKVLADYAAAITNTSSETMLRALALLFIGDTQFEFTEQQKSRFISCANGMDDLKVDLFIKLVALKRIDLDTVYPISVVSNVNFSELDLNVEIDELFAYVEDFLKRGLILKDPRADSDGMNFHVPENSDWSISFGISSTLQRYASLLTKAKYLRG
jgi:hypothetical protein